MNFFSIFNSKECFCGNEELPLQMKVSDNMCNMPCSGDPNLKCGDYLHINIYQTGLASKYNDICLTVLIIFYSSNLWDQNFMLRWKFMQCFLALSINVGKYS